MWLMHRTSAHRIGAGIGDTIFRGTFALTTIKGFGLASLPWSLSPVGDWFNLNLVTQWMLGSPVYHESCLVAKDHPTNEDSPCVTLIIAGHNRMTPSR